MDYQDVMTQLEAAGSAQTRKTYGRHGVTGAMFGVSFAELNRLKKAIRQDHGLARQLWDSEHYEARVLATMIANPELMDMDLLESWMRQVDSPPLSDAFVSLVARSPLIDPCMELWKHSDVELVGKIYWNLVARRAMAKNALDDSAFEPYLGEIAAGIHQQPDRIRHAMNQALIAIGIRSPKLEQRARAAAKKIGKVVVDHGDTSCKTPDAIDYIKRSLAKKGHLIKPEAKEAVKVPAKDAVKASSAAPAKN